MVTQRIFNTRLLIYLLTFCLLTYLPTSYLLIYLLTYYLLIYLHLTATSATSLFSRVAGILYEPQWQNHVVGL